MPLFTCPQYVSMYRWAAFRSPYFVSPHSDFFMCLVTKTINISSASSSSIVYLSVAGKEPYCTTDRKSAERAPMLTAAVKQPILPGPLHNNPLPPTFKGLKCHTVRKLARNSQEIASSRWQTDCRRNYSILPCFGGRVRNKNLLPKCTPININCHTLLITQWSNVKVLPDCIQVSYLKEKIILPAGYFSKSLIHFT